MRPDDSGGNVVTMRIKRPQAEDVVVEYSIRQKEGDGLKVYDIIVEGVSMLTTQRSEFNSVVSQKGLDYLIAQLKRQRPTKTLGTRQQTGNHSSLYATTGKIMQSGVQQPIELLRFYLKIDGCINLLLKLKSYH